MTRFFISFCILFLLAGAKPSENLRKNQKSVKVSSHGSGQSLEEARNNALINALQIVSGSYVSSSIAVENDVIIKNNINVFTSGSIKSAKILTKEVIDKRHCLLMEVEVYPTGLMENVNKYSSSKINIQPDVFLDNLRLYKIQSKAEEKAVLEISKTYKEIIQKGLSYKIIAFNNKVGKTNSVNIELVISVENLNKAFSQAKIYAYKSLSNLSIKPTEEEFILKLTSKDYLDSYRLKPIGAKGYNNISIEAAKAQEKYLKFRNDYYYFYILFSEDFEHLFEIKIGSDIVLTKGENSHYWENGNYKGLSLSYANGIQDRFNKNIIYLSTSMYIKHYEQYFSNVKNIEIIKSENI